MKLNDSGYEAQLKTQPNNVELMLRLARLYVATEHLTKNCPPRALEAEPETLVLQRSPSLEWAGRPEEAFKHHLILAKAMDERPWSEFRSLLQVASIVGLWMF